MVPPICRGMQAYPTLASQYADYFKLQLELFNKKGIEGAELTVT